MKVPKIQDCILPVILLVGMVFFGSCTKEPDKIGLDIIPPGEELGLSRIDTITIQAYSILEDSVRTDEMSSSTIGGFFDPVFGRTTASVYTELSLSSVNLNFGEGAVIDSIFLYLSYSGMYGDSASSQTFRVYEMRENITYDSSYYSNQTAAIYQDTELGNFTFVPNVVDSVLVDTVKTAPHLRMPLNQNLAQRLLSGTTENYSTDEKFREFFKGIYITADPATGSGQGSLVRFNLLSSLTRLTVHYHNNEKDSLSYFFYIGSLTPRFNNFNHHQYADADPLFRQQVINGDTTLGNSRIYLQPFGGVKAKLRMPFLPAISGLSKHVVVNEARLIFSNADTQGTLAAPALLGIGRIADTANRYVILQDQYEGDAFFGGSYVSDISGYRFRLTRYVQQRLLNPDADDFGLILLISGASVNPQRLILHGGQAEEAKIKMVITYSTIE